MTTALETRPAALRRTPTRQLIADLSSRALDDALDQLKEHAPKARQDEYQRLALLALRQHIDTTLEAL